MVITPPAAGEATMKDRRAMLGLAGALAVLMSGCYESATPTQYEPGVYKGQYDPLNAKLESGKLDDQLSERFETTARDR